MWRGGGRFARDGLEIVEHFVHARLGKEAVAHDCDGRVVLQRCNAPDRRKWNWGAQLKSDLWLGRESTGGKHWSGGVSTDKYDLSSGLPIYPGGFAEPERTPLFPQRIAEIMAGRIPVDESRARQAQSLQQVIVGPETAAEIGWKVATAPALE